MNRLSALISALLLVWLPFEAFATEVLGTALIAGRRVELLDDGTWRYVDPAAGACHAIAPQLRFCGDVASWESTQPPNNDIVASYRYDDRHYGQFVLEGLGTDDGLSLEFIRGTIIDNAALVTGRSSSEVPILSVETAAIGDFAGETVVYALNFEGIDAIYANTILVTPKSTLQAMTFAIGSEFTPKHQSIHAAFLEEIQFDG